MKMDDEKTIAAIKESLDYLDSKVDVNIPEFNEFRKLVSAVEEKKKYSMQLQFILFMVTALLIVCVETFSFYKSFAFFAGVQVFAIASILCGIAIKQKRKGRRENI